MESVQERKKKIQLQLLIEKGLREGLGLIGSWKGWGEGDRFTFLFLSSAAYFSAACTMFSMSSLLSPPEDWMMTGE